ncbi:MAG: hypothetical protein HYZ28_27085 [Myxococcales bacterium]|nr:hypothetical protein [Myxococcales bacterium]
MLGAPAPAVSAPEPGQAVVRTRVGAFVVRTKVAGELERALFGEPTQHQFYAGSD